MPLLWQHWKPGWDDVQLSHVQQALIHEEQKLQTQLQLSSASSYGSQPTSALLGGQRETNINKVKCFECGQAGHFCCDCPNRKGTYGSIKTVRKAKTAVEDNSSDSDTDNIEVFTASVSFVDTQQMSKWLVHRVTWQKRRHCCLNTKNLRQQERLVWVIDVIGVGNVHVKMKLTVGEPRKYVIYRVLAVCTRISLWSVFSKSCSC